MNTETIDPILYKMFLKYGAPIEFQEDETLSDLYKPLLNQVNRDFLKSFEQKHKISVSVYIIDNNEINGCVFKLHSDNSYAIFINDGLIQKSIEIAGLDIDFLKKDLANLGEIEDIMALFTQNIFLHLIGHEAGHIINGHLEISKNNFIDESKILELNMIKLPNSTLISSPNIFKHFMEMDADTYSLSYLVTNIVNLQNKYLVKHKKDVFEELIKLSVYSIYLLHNSFGFFQVKDDNYPTSFYRAYLMIERISPMIQSIYKQHLHEKIDEYVQEASFSIFSYLDDYDENFFPDNYAESIHRYNHIISAEYSQYNSTYRKLMSQYKF